ncbi:hypothetical protein KA005_61020, partial [bacterium]|nr:hypothetical protein [bacterium]
AGDGKTPYAMVGMLQSDIAYMNYMFGSTDNFINSSVDPATVSAGEMRINTVSMDPLMSKDLQIILNLKVKDGFLKLSILMAVENVIITLVQKTLA